jgi:hypothetical protein
MDDNCECVPYNEDLINGDRTQLKPLFMSFGNHGPGDGQERDVRNEGTCGKLRVAGAAKPEKMFNQENAGR